MLKTPRLFAPLTLASIIGCTLPKLSEEQKIAQSIQQLQEEIGKINQKEIHGVKTTYNGGNCIIVTNDTIPTNNTWAYCENSLLIVGTRHQECRPRCDEENPPQVFPLEKLSSEKRTELNTLIQTKIDSFPIEDTQNNQNSRSWIQNAHEVAANKAAQK